MMQDGDSQAQSGWSHDNDRGLTLAADGAWPEAAAAFQAAADALAQDLPLRPATHEPLALVLGNLAHACFKAGRMDDALQHAQRTCALRVAIAGEDGMPVARARMDLAVMLASCGRGEEAMTLVQRAIAAIEHRVGDEDARLAIVLENAARIALALGSPSNAEPLLLRLHALLHAHELSTGRAEKLLAKVAEVRDQQRVVPRTRTPAPSTRVATPTTGIMLQRVAETIELKRLTLDDLEPLDEPEPIPVAAPASSEVREPTPLGIVAFETPGSSDALEVREYAHASIDAPAAWEEEPVIERPPIAEPVSVARGNTVSPIFRDLDRGPTIAMPTPDRGVRTIETPSRAPRAVVRDEPPARREPAAEVAAPRSAKVAAPEAKSAVYLPMILGTVAAVAAGAGAVWWFILR
jgi:tetratricopeptide (TPR) repeat protein